MDPPQDPRGIPAPARGRARSRVVASRTPASTTQTPAAAEPASIPTDVTPTAATAPIVSAVVPTTIAPAAAPVPASTTAPSTSAASAAVQPPLPQGGMQQLSISDDPARASKYSQTTTRPATMLVKQSTQTPTLKMVTNYFEACIAEHWAIHQYAVSFDPPLEDQQTAQRKGLFKTVARQLPPSLFDGLILFTVKELQQGPIILTTTDKFTDAPVTITIDCHKTVDRRDPVCWQIYNIFVRRCLEHCDLVQMGRKYFDKHLRKQMPNHNLEIWPGFATSLRFFETSLLLNVESVCKVIRTKSVLDIIKDAMNLHSNRMNEAAIRKLIEGEVEGRIVMTKYNNQTYPIEKILWNETANDTFPSKDGEKGYATYYKTRWGIDLTDLKQPLLLAAQKEKDLRKSKKPLTQTKLIPELCFATGLTDSMRNNFNLMKELGEFAHLKPGARVDTLRTFMKRFIDNTEIKKEMATWEIEFTNTNLVQVPGKQLKEEKVYQGQKEYTYDLFSRGQNFRDHLHDPLTLNRWYAVVPSMFNADFQKFTKDMQSVCRSMNLKLGTPKVDSVSRSLATDYLNAIETFVAKVQGKVDIVFIVLPNNRLELYSVLKQKLTKDYGIPSQCCLSKNLKKGLSVATKIAVQMSCKVGGIPWIIRNPFKENICVVGFDVFHSGGTGGCSYGAIVATINSELSKSCSFIQAHKHRDEVCQNMGVQLTKCLREYRKANNCLPTKIFFYRDGVGDGQIETVISVELASAKEALSKLCEELKIEESLKPKMTYTIVSKRINSRFMVDRNGVFDNPPPGTIVDDVVTLFNRYDFFLVSQTARQGTVSPTSYNVIYDENNMPPGRMQTFSYKLCHNYYNWNGTLSVPSVCQNAHKLAYITGEAIKGPCKEELRLLPHYL